MLVRRAVAVLVLAVSSLLLAGCFLKQVLGAVVIEDLGEFIDRQLVSLDAGATTATCRTSFGEVDCTYVIDGWPVESSARLISEFGFFGVIVDPLILQVPANARAFSATFTGAGNGAIEITELVGGFDADARTHVDPEPGHRFVVLDFPTAATPGAAADYSFRLTYEQNAEETATPPPPLAVKAVAPVRLKAMFAGRVTARGKTFYPPMLPCVTNFADVPSITLPLTATLSPVALPPVANRGCNRKAYIFDPSALATSEVVEYHHAGLDHYFVTGLESEVRALDRGTQIRGWARTGRTFKTYSNAEAGTTPVCRYYIPPALGDSHFYGRGTAECDATGQQHPQFVLESSAFMHLRLPDNGACALGTQPVYRVFSNRFDANHRYTTDRAVRDQMVAAGWLAEGDGPDRVVMCAPL